MTVLELYEQLRPFVRMCPDEEVLIAVTSRFRMKQFYPASVDRSDWGEREIVVYAVTPSQVDGKRSKPKAATASRQISKEK